jgi:hypothetical protein
MPGLVRHAGNHIAHKGRYSKTRATLQKFSQMPAGSIDDV